MRIVRARGPGAVVSLVAMIDVLMILLVFFMVTSTYLDLDMVRLAGADRDSVDAASSQTLSETSEARLLIRLGADGAAFVQGRPLDNATLGAEIVARLQDTPDLDVIVLPSGQADVQALARVMDIAVGAGAARLRIVRLSGVQP